MSEFHDLFKEEFFIIDSDNLDSVEDKLYGFILKDGEVLRGTVIENFTGEGTYVSVQSSESEITVHQDFNGSYGLYVYNKDGNFAISNSFLHLVEHLKTKYGLSLNEDYAKLLMSCGLCSMVFRETLINEIECIPRNYIIRIDKPQKSLNFEKIDYEEHSINLDSEEGLKTLDKWFNKWIAIIRSLKSKTNNIQVDLSGGFDSRVIAVLWLCANIDLDKIYIRSFDDDNHCHSEDFEIASKIASEFNFPLNNNVISSNVNYFKDIKTILNMSFYTKLGFHNQLNYRFGKTEEPVYFISGIAGEIIRESRLYGGKTPEELTDYLARISKRRQPSFEKSTKRIITRTLDNLSEEFNIEDRNSLDLTNLVYPEAKCRNHFGKLTVEEYFSNKMALAPALDPDLHKLKLTTSECGDNYLLIALIIMRYCPKLLEFEFEGGRHFNPETLDEASRINEISPFQSENPELITGPDTVVNSQAESSDFSWPIVNDYLKNIFNSRKFEMEFRKYFSQNFYYRISKSIDTRDYFPLQEALPAFSVLKIIKDIEISNLNDSGLDDWIESFDMHNYERDIPLQSSKLILKYATARVDVKNYGNEGNSIEIFDVSDDDANLRSPKWFADSQGSGKFINSIKGNLKFRIKCINDGNLRISLKSLDVKDVNKVRFPIYIDYTNLFINGNECLDGNVLATHDEPFVFQKSVKDGEVVEVEVNWLPFYHKSNYRANESSQGVVKKLKKRFF